MKKIRFEMLSKYTIKTIAVFILSFLTVFSFFFTQRCGKEINGEVQNKAPIYEINDNIFVQIAGILFVIAVFGVLRCLYAKVISKKGELYKKKILLIFRIISAFLGVLISVMILKGGVRTPIDDQIQVYNAAVLFNDGNYTNLMPGGYISMYPQQLGYILYMQLIFLISGSTDFYLLQLMNCFFIGGIVYFLSKCIYMFTEDFTTNMIGNFLVLGTIPLYLLETWVYGDIPGFFFIFMAVYYFLLAYKNTFQKWYKWLPILTICCMLAVLFRKNNQIFVLAMLMVLFVTFMKKISAVVAAVIIILITMSVVPSNILYRQYERVSGYEIEGGLPSNMWIAMGMLQDASKPGWFNNYSVPVFYEENYDRERSAERANQRIAERAEEFAENPIEMVSFYKRKICTQWNDPFYNTEHLAAVDEGETALGLTEFIVNNENLVRTFLSVQQMLIYFGAFIYCIRLKVKDNLIYFLPYVILIGGFLFSILWEANSRYIFPYVLMLLPVSIAGWGIAADYLATFDGLDIFKKFEF